MVRPLQRDATIERPRMLRAVRALGAIALAVILLFAAGPNALRRAARVMFAPWSEAEAAAPALAVRVQPGNVSIPRGAAVDVEASLFGFGAEGAELVLRADSATEWTRIPMLRRSVAGGFTLRLFDVARPTQYYVNANGIHSPSYAIRVTDLPATKGLSLDLHYPAYTGLSVEHIENGGDVAAVVGTMVVVHARTTMPVKGATIVFDDGLSIPFASDGSDRLRAAFRIRRTGYYRIDLVSPDGAKVPGPVQYAVDALDDHPPQVSIVEPGRDTKVTNVDEVTIGVKASDDYGVSALELRYRVNGGPEQRVALSDSTHAATKEARAAHTLFLEELNLPVGALVAYHAVARDGAGHEGKSDLYFLEVRRFDKRYRQADQGGGGGGGGGGDSPDAFAARQREVVAGTFNWLRDSATTGERQRREDMATLNIAEGRLREDVANLARRIADRGMSKKDSLYLAIQAELDTAVAPLRTAEEQLVQRHGTDALPPEQRALEHLQRAEELYRDVQVQMGQGGQGGGQWRRGNQRAEELADLFELQTDKLKNQYEAMSQEQQQQSSQRDVDATLERLKQLAARQQQENERMQRMAEAMRARLGRNQGGGGGSGASQRELAQQAEEEARRLERLAREQKSQEMADVAQRVQRAADAMKRAASGSQSQGRRALHQLRSAASGVEGSRSAAMSEAMKRLAQQARDLEERERQIGDEVKAYPSSTPEQRAAALDRLNAQKDALSRDVGRLETDANRLAREEKRSQPEAAGKLAQAAEAIRDQRIRDKIAFSKNVLRAGSPEYATAFEQQIAQNLGDVSGRMRAAASSVTPESAAGGQSRAVDQTRELLQGLESLRGRTGSGNTGGDGRQISREFGLRRAEARQLREQLARQGVDVSKLDEAIGGLGKLEARKNYGDTRGLTDLQTSIIERLKSFEFAVYRHLVLGPARSPMLRAHASVPDEYRAALEEYYRSLAAPPRKKR